MSMFQTQCEGCYFAKVDNQIQTGCQLNRLEIFKNKGLAEQQGNYYLINTFCNSVRSEKWASKQENPIQSIINERRSTTLAIVKYNKQYEKTLDSVFAQELPFTEVRLLINGTKVSNDDIAYILSKYGQHKNFTISHELQFRKFDKILLDWTYNKLANSITTTYFTYLEQPVESLTLTKELDILINENLEKVYKFKFPEGSLELTLMYKYSPEPKYKKEQIFYAKN